MTIYELLQRLMLIATAHLTEYADTSNQSPSSPAPPSTQTPSTPPPPLHPRAQTTPPPPNPGNIPTSLHYTTLSAILTHSATPWTTLTYENIYFNSILLHNGLDTNLPYPSTITPTSVLSKKSEPGKGGVSFETGEAALLHEGTAWSTITYVDVLEGGRVVSEFYVTGAGMRTGILGGAVVAVSSMLAAATVTTSSSSAGAVGSGSISSGSGSTQVPNLAPCRTATDFDGCVSSAESVAVVTGGQGVGSSMIGMSGEGTGTTGVGGIVVGQGQGQGQGQGEVMPTTTVTMPYLGAVVAKGKATFVEGGVESGGVEGKGRVKGVLWLWFEFVVMGGWLGGLVL